jgi:hypothetical protein
LTTGAHESNRRLAVLVAVFVVALGGVGNATAHAYTTSCVPIPDAAVVITRYHQATKSLTEPNRTQMNNEGVVIEEGYRSRGNIRSGVFVTAMLRTANKWMFDWSCVQADFLAPAHAPGPATALAVKSSASQNSAATPQKAPPKKAAKPTQKQKSAATLARSATATATATGTPVAVAAATATAAPSASALTIGEIAASPPLRT